MLDDTETDIPEPEDIEMGDACATNDIAVGTTASLPVECHGCKAQMLRLEEQVRAYKSVAVGLDLGKVLDTLSICKQHVLHPIVKLNPERMLIFHMDRMN